MITHGQKWRHKMGERATMFFFVGLAVSLVVIAFVWQSTAGRRTGIGESADDWRLKRLLPAGAEIGSAGQAFLDVPAGGRVVGYALGGQAYLALLEPDASGSLRVVDTLDMTKVDPVLTGEPHVVARIIGPGAAPAVITRSSSDFGTVGVLFAKIGDERIEPLELVDGGGNLRPAVFHHGYVTEGIQEFSLEDLDGDGTEEAVVKGQYAVSGDGTASLNSSVDVYAWREGRWNYDSEMSLAMTARNGLFPEPPGDGPDSQDGN